MVQVAHHPAAVRVGAAADRAGCLAASRQRRGNLDHRRARHHRPRLPHRLPVLVADHRAGNGAGAVAAGAADAGDHRPARQVVRRHRPGPRGAIRGEGAVGRGLPADGDRPRARVSVAGLPRVRHGERELRHRRHPGHRLDAAVLLRGVGRGHRAAVADAAAHRGAVVDTSLIARAAVRRAADRDRRRLLEPLPDAARPAGRRLARAGDRVHLDLRRRDRDGAAARGAARRRAGEPACAPAGDRLRTGGRAHRDHWSGRPHRVRERRVLPRVRLLARGARLAAAEPARRARIVRPRSRRSSSGCGPASRCASRSRSRARTAAPSTPPAPPRRLSTTPAGSRILSASSATSPRSCGCASSWCAASGCRRSASSSPASRTRSTTRCNR